MSAVPKTPKSFAEQAAYLEAQEARIRARKVTNRAKQIEHDTARVRRLGEALLKAAEEEAKSPSTHSSSYKELIEKSDTAAEKDAQQRKDATKEKKGNATKEATKKVKESETES